MSEIAPSVASTSTPASARGRGRPRGFDTAQAMEQASALFYARGYDRVTLNDLTTVMGINPPSFYSAFGNKALLFIRVADAYSRALLDDIRGAFEDEPTLPDALETILLSAARRFAFQDGRGGCLILEAASNCSDAGVTAHLRKARLTIAATLYRGIARTAPERVVELTDHVMMLLAGFSAMGRDGMDTERLMRVAASALQPLCDPAERL